MALPEHDAVLGRLAAARLRAANAGVRLDAHPDAETWAAYADGGLLPDEVVALDAHLAACASCRRVLAAFASEPADAAPALEIDEAPGPARVLPFRPRVTWAWMSIAAGLLGAVTIWTVMRLQQPEMASTMAERTMPAPAAPPIATPPAEAKAVPAAPPADAIRRSEPSAAIPAAQAPSAPLSGAARATTGELDRAKTGLDKTLAVSDERRDRAAFAEARPSADAAPLRAPAPKPEAAAGATTGTAATSETLAVTRSASPTVASRAPATPGVHGPAINTQQQNMQANANAQREEAQLRAAQAAARTQQEKERAAAPAEAPRQAAISPPPPATPPPAAEPQAVGGVAEIVSTAPPAATRSGSRAGGFRSAKRDAAASRDQSDLALADGAAPVGFAEPGGRLRWRIAGGSRIESSSDGGATWTPRYEATERLHAGSAPAIEAAWAVGDRGLVLRLAVPGSWTAVSRPASVTLVAVTASSADAARVTAEDGRVFETTDGGRSWRAVAGAPR